VVVELSIEIGFGCNLLVKVLRIIFLLGASIVFGVYLFLSA
jgi:hypothetical protein